MKWLPRKKLAVQKRAWSQSEANQIDQALFKNRSLTELVLFHVGIDTMLRINDLLQLKVHNVRLESGAIKEEYVLKQMKTGEAVEVVLHSQTRQLLKQHIQVSGKQANDFLFTSPRFPKKSISDRWVRVLVKKWTRLIGLEPSHYSCHSLRRTGASFLYKVSGNDLEAVRLALGHSSLEATRYYLGIDRQNVVQILKNNPMWNNYNNRNMNKSPMVAWIDQQLEMAEAEQKLIIDTDRKQFAFLEGRRCALLEVRGKTRDKSLG